MRQPRRSSPSLTCSSPRYVKATTFLCLHKTVRITNEIRSRELTPSAHSEECYSDSSALGFGLCKLVGALPGTLHFFGRGHFDLEGAVAGDLFKLSAAAGVLPCTFHAHLAPACRNLAFERTPVTAILTMVVDEVPALAAFAVNNVRDAPIRYVCLVPLLVAGFL